MWFYNRLFVCVFIMSFCGLVNAQIDTSIYKDWMIGPFEKEPEGINPILGPNFDSKFYCPLERKEVRWESRAIIGGAVVVKDNQIFMIYQGEDDSRGYNLHTHGSPSIMRLGLAVSSDGINFTRRSPVLYPQDDLFLDKEGGGCEIPRLVESPDGGYVLLYDGCSRLPD
ncbi:hypothetical protein [Parabacteroides distasonis]|uniref:Glycosyl hydrolase family 32 N-terminal domain-containing protein n=1 Tax=Parabacteroides distasonis TaxID=823 RepID=A0A4S2EQF9_PARDI|nr:hypothetical protein [Parabacteroides distasonis]TGY58469.1 hypothetical protein E5342_08105 [Parabacteroides distasonis]